MNEQPQTPDPTELKPAMAVLIEAIDASTPGGDTRQLMTKLSHWLSANVCTQLSRALGQVEPGIEGYKLLDRASRIVLTVCRQDQNKESMALRRAELARKERRDAKYETSSTSNNPEAGASQTAASPSWSSGTRSSERQRDVENKRAQSSLAQMRRTAEAAARLAASINGHSSNSTGGPVDTCANRPTSRTDVSRTVTGVSPTSCAAAAATDPGMVQQQPPRPQPAQQQQQPARENQPRMLKTRRTRPFASYHTIPGAIRPPRSPELLASLRSSPIEDRLFVAVMEQFREYGKVCMDIPLEPSKLPASELRRMAAEPELPTDFMLVRREEWLAREVVEQWPERLHYV